MSIQTLPPRNSPVDILLILPELPKEGTSSRISSFFLLHRFFPSKFGTSKLILI